MSLPAGEADGGDPVPWTARKINVGAIHPSSAFNDTLSTRLSLACVSSLVGTGALCDCLREGTFSFYCSRRHREKRRYIALDHDSEPKSTTCSSERKKTDELPDEIISTVGAERFRRAEGRCTRKVFSGKEARGIHDTSCFGAS